MKITVLKNVIKKGLLLGGVGMLLFAAVPMVAQAAPSDDACEGIKAAGGTCDNSAAGADTLKPVIETIIEVLSIVAGAVAVIMIIIGGLKYVLANGDTNAVSSAKNTILYAVIGLVIVIFARIIVSFVYSTATTPPASSSESESQEEGGENQENSSENSNDQGNEGEN